MHKRPNHPTTGEKHPLTGRLKNQNIQPVEGSGRLASPHTTKSSNHRRKPPAYQPAARSNHPAGGRKQTPNIPSHSQTIQPVERNTCLPAGHRSKSPESSALPARPWNQNASRGRIEPSGISLKNNRRAKSSQKAAGKSSATQNPEIPKRPGNGEHRAAVPGPSWRSISRNVRRRSARLPRSAGC